MHDTYKCKYCSTLFKEPRTDAIVCPNCGAPDPTRIVPEVYQRAVETYIPVPTPTGNYYRNPQPSRSEWVYDTFGYKVASFLFGGTAIVLIGLFVYFWFFHRIGAPKDSDPAYQNMINTPVPTVTAYAPNPSPVDILAWLSTSEALDLRTQENVVNLAYLNRGGAKYTDVSLVFNQTWEMTKPQGITELQVTGTFVTMKVNGDKYVLNVYQPFVIAGQEQVVFIVDQNGQIWKKILNTTDLLSLDQVQQFLPTKLEVNPNLNPTY